VIHPGSASPLGEAVAVQGLHPGRVPRFLSDESDGEHDLRGDLTDAEYADFFKLHDRACRGEHLSHDDSNRHLAYQLRIAAPPTPEWDRKHDEKLRAQKSDIVVAYAAGRRRSRTPAPRSRAHDRGGSRRRVRRTVRLAAHGPPGRSSGDDDLPPRPLVRSHGRGRAVSRTRGRA